jgi:hypothetical protein
MTLNTEILRDSSSEQRPWFKEPWLWLVILLPVASVVAGISTVIIAYKHADDLVNDDYYKVGIAINQNIESEELATDLGLHGRMFFSGEKVQLQIQAESNSAMLFPEKIMLELFHPTLKRDDISVELKQQSNGLYTAAFNITHLDGKRYLRITPFNQDWILKQEILVRIGEPVNLDVR